MNDNAKAWVAALRSDEYAQTRGALNRVEASNADPVGMCCLGVACDLAVKEGLATWVAEAGNDDCLAVKTGHTADSGALPFTVMKWLGISGELGEYDDDDRSLAGHNDGGATFAEIADIIESEPEGLFVS